MSWPMVKIGDVCTLTTGGTPRTNVSEFYENGTVPWIVSGDIHKGEIFDCEKRITEYAVENSNARYLPKDSVLIALNGQGKTRGTVALLRIKGATCNQSVVSINPNNKEELYSDYLFYYLKSQYQSIRNITGDQDRAGLNMPLIRDISIPLPALAEQKRIAAILSRADAIYRKRQQATQLADELLRAVFLDRFGDPETQGWEFTTVGNMAAKYKGSMRTGPFGSDLKHSEFISEGISVLGIDNAVNNTFKWGKERFISQEKYEQLKRYTVNPGDVLITIMGTCGRCAVVPDDIPLAINTKHLCCITLDKNLCLPSFLHAYFLVHPISRRYLGQVAKGAIMDGLNLGMIKEMPIPIVPINEQKKYEAISIKVAQLIANQNEGDDFTKNNFLSISRKAFLGKL